MTLSILNNDAEIASVLEALRRDGAVVVKNLIDPSVVAAVCDELREELDAVGLERKSAFNGSLTNRIGNVLEVAPSAAALLEHDTVVAVANNILLPHCANYRISSMTAIEVMPDEAAQALHRDDTPYPIDIAGMELQIGVMWSLNDFTQENGGTRVVPGSHQLLRSWHLPDLSRWESAVMPKGSALFYLGSTWHGAGANKTNQKRMGLINVYSLGWLRQEVNQYLTHPPSVASKFSPRLRALLGYTTHSAGDDRLGNLRGDCPAWVETPPEEAWYKGRDGVGTEQDAKSQSGV
ncbi:MAG: phytanoyl-CoA dioxygenase family protein [Alphaproteobacteria bacterium]